MENSSFTLDNLVKHIHEQAVSLTAANRYVDQRLFDDMFGQGACFIHQGLVKFEVGHRDFSPPLISLKSR
jgi:hypothetical protein